MAPTQFFTQETRDRLRIAFDHPPTNQIRLDTSVRVLASLGFKARWVVEWFPDIPLNRCERYFRGEPIQPEDSKAIEEAAWRTVYAAQELLLQMSLDGPDMITNSKWLAFSRRIYDCGSALEALHV